MKFSRKIFRVLRCIADCLAARGCRVFFSVIDNGISVLYVVLIFFDFIWWCDIITCVQYLIDILLQDSDTVPCMWYYEQIIHHSADLSCLWICKYINKRSCYKTSLFIRITLQDNILIRLWLSAVIRRGLENFLFKQFKAEVNWHHWWF